MNIMKILTLCEEIDFTDNNYDIPSDYIGLIPSEYVKMNKNSNNSDLFTLDYNILSSTRNGRKKLLTMNKLTVIMMIF